MSVLIDDTVSLVRREVSRFDEYTWWVINFEGCRECYSNIKNDHCYLIDGGKPWDCPAFEDHFNSREINGMGYFDLLQALDAIIGHKTVSFGGKKYKLMEVKE